jgi:hypothetical protein
MKHRSLALGAAGVAAGVALGLTGFAGAVTPSPSPSPGSGAQPDLEQRFDRHGPGGKGFGFRGERMGGYGGLVTAIDSDSLTVSTPGGSQTVALNGSTEYYVGKTKSTRSAISKGDVVHVRVADPRATKKVASVVSVVPAHLSGWVTKVDADEITITDHDGFTRTIKTSGSTTYEKDGASATRSAITVGAFVHAVGAVDDNGTTLDAERVSVGMPKLDGKRFRGGPMDGPPMDAPDAQQGSYPQA